MSYYVIRDGPLKECCVVVLSDDDKANRLHVLIDGGDWLTPPVYIARSHLKESSPFMHSSWWAKMGVLGVLAGAICFMAGQGVAAWSLFLVGGAVIAIYIVKLKTISHRLKTCPLCASRLDLDTYFRCDACEWTRPMPPGVDPSFYDSETNGNDSTHTNG